MNFQLSATMSNNKPASSDKLKYYIVHFEGNNSKGWDGKETYPANLMSQSILPASLMSESNAVTALPPLPLSTPTKLVLVEEVMKDYPGSDVATLRKLTIALASEAIRIWQGRDV